MSFCGAFGQLLIFCKVSVRHFFEQPGCDVGHFEAFKIVGCVGRLSLFIMSLMVWLIISLMDLVIGSVQIGRGSLKLIHSILEVHQQTTNL